MLNGTSWSHYNITDNIFTHCQLKRPLTLFKIRTDIRIIYVCTLNTQDIFLFMQIAQSYEKKHIFISKQKSILRNVTGEYSFIIYRLN